MPGLTSDETALLARVAWLYYQQGLTQQQIGERLGNMSRVKVVRLLAKARQEGIVQIRIVHPSLRCLELEYKFASHFGIREAWIVPTGEDEERNLAGLGQMAAMYLEQTLQDGDVLGTAWGRTLRAVGFHLRPVHLKNFTVVQLMGGLDVDGQVNPLDIIQLVASKLGARYELLYTPVLVESAATKKALLADSQVARTLKAAEKVNKALVGIGDLAPDSSLIRHKVLTESDVNVLRQHGAVGDILCRHFTIDGTPIESEVSERTMSLPLEALKRVKTVIAVAGGPRKAPSILGALRGGYVDVLITDEDTARAVLDLSRAHKDP